MPDDFNPTEWITTAEAAQLTGYNARYLRQLVNEGKIRSVKRGGIFWLDRSSAAAYADRMKQLGSAKHDPWRVGARRKSNGAE
jgi:excisionase family DNA binding protein